MNLKFRAFDSESTFRMYKPEEVWVSDGVAWIIDNDSYDENLVFNNNLIIMQSTGLTDKNGREIFEGDIVTDGQTVGDIKHHQTYGFYMIDDKGIERFFSDGNCIEDFEEDAETISEILEIIGNIYENPELLDE